MHTHTIKQKLTHNKLTHNKKISDKSHTHKYHCKQTYVKIDTDKKPHKNTPNKI